ncbi:MULTISPECIES: 2Fe-2S iron-sulfur cluster binding domain-containing protein [Pseudomonas]|uniref:2Fe-2S iron-sulfur cluster binding domain-containing protein n=2 Tax=Pseudomonas TaxID=286 RepID=A0A6G6ITF1_PSENT|nr:MULTISPECIES: 2Fe-2S iron-sulfur cluster binding domain-containing protein [Pseudomonas]NWD82508.1 2Fe-2S iron-sulfur cluster binding domain-containing protein [Pseudomonas reactans]NWE87086.1 2Fe-2S iron-sulfur cluster binding domain-containing protein [Pseudomonas reactans]QIE86100.1 2Fe-2S iron-sulfur cluster binding domain-containing protein [Pseudomonas nitroreducens]HCE6398420.1 2Fe-2S iron-sulfur cluster binding domain-containing protein [Pseudomonas aeruginosa]
MLPVFEISMQSGGERFTCPPRQSVLQAMERDGLNCVPVGCRGGGCGLCKVQVLAGDYLCGPMSSRHVPPEARAQGQVLACRLYPLSDLMIECCARLEVAAAITQQKR